VPEISLELVPQFDKRQGNVVDTSDYKLWQRYDMEDVKKITEYPTQV
jgi:hypothetical protein